MRECQQNIEQKIDGMKAPTVLVYSNDNTLEESKENYNASLLNGINDNCSAFKRTACVLNDASIGVEF